MKNSSNPATQADIRLLREDLSTLREDLLKWKGSIIDYVERRLTEFRQELHEEMLTHREQITHHFDVVFENYARDSRRVSDGL